MIVFYLDYIPRRGEIGSGGWSKQAKHRPNPKVMKYIGPVTFRNGNGKAVILDNLKHNKKRKLKCVIFDDSQVPPKLIRADHDVSWLWTLGCDMPPIYTNFNGHIVASNGNIIMRGPPL